MTSPSKRIPTTEESGREGRSGFPYTDATMVGLITRLTLLWLIVQSVLTASPPSDDFLPFSVWYAGGKARAPTLEPLDGASRLRWKRDLEQIRSLGFNTVRTWVEWTAGEPRPGEYHFEQLELLAELAAEVGLRFMVQVYVDSAPDWVGDRHPGARFVAQSGEAIRSQSAPGYCFDHPEIRKKVLDFYRAAARAATRHDNFAGWDLWSEPHIINWAIIDFIPHATFCYCSNSQDRFRRWLREKYGSLAELNSAWRRSFTEWRQVEPPRFGTILSYTDFIDWRRFIQEKLAADLGARAAAVREVDPEKVVTSHAAVPCLFTSPLWGVGAPDDWLMASQVDFWGTSIYPKHSYPDRHWTLLRRSILMDFARSAGRANSGFYVGELQAGMGIRGTVVGDPVTPLDHRQWVWSLIARGARAINVYAYYPMNSGYEAGGYGLVNLDGTLTERSRRLGRIAATVDRNRGLFLNARPPAAEVALIYNPLSYFVGGYQQTGDTGIVRESLTGYYRALWENQIAVDFVHLTEVETGSLDGYRVAVLPYPLMLTESVARRLKEFVRQGGTLIAEARCGWNDDRGHAQQIIPGFGLHRLFRVREGKLRMVDEVELALSQGEDSGESGALPGRGIQEELLIEEGAAVLARFPDGSAALTRSDYGSGRAFAVGSFLGAANAAELNPAFESWLLSVLEETGVRPRDEISLDPPDARVEVRRLQGDGYNLLFVFNHDGQAARVEVGSEAALDLEARAGVTFPLLVPAGEVRVLKIVD